MARRAALGRPTNPGNISVTASHPWPVLASSRWHPDGSGCHLHMCADLFNTLFNAPFSTQLPPRGFSRILKVTNRRGETAWQFISHPSRSGGFTTS